MPCSDGGPSCYNVEGDSLRDTIDDLEAMLCSACRALELKNFDFDLNPQLSRWWANHKKKDEARVAEEIRERNERLLAQGIAMSLTIAELKNLNGEQRALLKKHGFI